MEKFIEATEVGGRKVLIGISKIVSVWERMDEVDGVFIEIALDMDGDSIGIRVRESYAEIKQKICEVY